GDPEDADHEPHRNYEDEARGLHEGGGEQDDDEADDIAEPGVDHGLLEDDPVDVPVGGPDGLEGAELAQVLDGRGVDRLSHDHHADQEGHQRGEGEADADSGLPRPVQASLPAVLLGGVDIDVTDLPQALGDLADVVTRGDTGHDEDGTIGSQPAREVLRDP